MYQLFFPCFLLDVSGFLQTSNVSKVIARLYFSQCNCNNFSHFLNFLTNFSWDLIFRKNILIFRDMLGRILLMETLKYSNVNFCILFLSLLYVQFQRKTNKQKKSLFLGVLQDTMGMEQLSTQKISSS